MQGIFDRQYGIAVAGRKPVRYGIPIRRNGT
jgi:hypothetical protein